MKKILSMICLIFLLGEWVNAQSNSSGGANYLEDNGLFGSVISSTGPDAGKALVYIDMSHTDDKVIAGLTAKGYTTTVAVSGTDFNTKLATGKFKMAVLFVQNYTATQRGIDLDVIKSHVDRGGRIIFASWRGNSFMGTSLWDDQYAAYFEAAYTGNNNQTTVTVTDPIFLAGITSPFTLTSAYWGVFSTGMRAIHDGRVVATFPNGDAAIISGNRGRTLILGYLSDTPATTEAEALVTSSINTVEAGAPVPVPYWIIAIGFVLIAAVVLVSKRKSIFA